MNIIQPSYRIETPVTGAARDAILRSIEAAGRTCYKSERKASDTSAPDFVRRIVKVHKHLSVIEHASITVRFIVDRGVSHELVRHRLAAFSQESTRYCNYSQEKFGREITVIKPPFWSPDDQATSARYMQWQMACRNAEAHYFALLDQGATPQEARSVLPNSLKTEVVMTCNLREWRHVFTMRCAPHAHPQMRQVMRPLLAELQTAIPEVFEDIDIMQMK